MRLFHLAISLFLLGVMVRREAEQSDFASSIQRLLICGYSPAFQNHQSMFTAQVLQSVSQSVSSRVSQSADGKALSQPGEPMVVLGLFKVTAQHGFASVKTTVAKLGAELSECVGRDFRSSMVNIFS